MPHVVLFNDVASSPQTISLTLGEYRYLIKAT